MKKEHKNTKKRNRQKEAIIGLSIVTGVLSASTLGLSIAYGITSSHAMQNATQLENIYKMNYYELVDSVNTADMKISKILASSDENFQAKTLSELSQSAKEMQGNIATLPLSNENILASVRFINQMSGYSQVLQEKIDGGESLTEQDLEILNQMHETLTEMKRYLNRMSIEMLHGYSILDASQNLNGDSQFSVDFAQIKDEGTDYPTMIYDGPFSDSVVNQKIKGLTGSEISKDDAYKKVDKIFKNISSIKYEGQTNGKFNTYNFSLVDFDGQTLYVQVTKIGGHILTVSGNVESAGKNISFEQAKKIATDFANENGIENVEIVWSEELESQAYFNITPKVENIIFYPDLVKVKVDLEHGNVIGYDAISYFTNHTGRTLAHPTFSIEEMKEKIDESFEIKNSRLVLAPLDYNREVVCFEFECERDGATYYIYLNATTGIEENILKVVETNDGSKLM